MTESRHFSRINFDSNIQIRFNNQTYEAHLLDISLRGALVELPSEDSIPLHESVLIDLQLGGSEITLEIEGELVHQHQNQFGFKFQFIDLESMTHLRRLIELNLGDSTEVDKELEFLSTH